VFEPDENALRLIFSSHCYVVLTRFVIPDLFKKNGSKQFSVNDYIYNKTKHISKKRRSRYENAHSVPIGMAKTI
jgi:hypothetical protein